MPPPGIPDWLYPGVVMLHDSGGWRWTFWVQGIEIAPDGSYHVTVHEAMLSRVPEAHNVTLVEVVREHRVLMLRDLLEHSVPATLAGAGSIIYTPTPGFVGGPLELRRRTEAWLYEAATWAAPIPQPEADAALDTVPLHDLIIAVRSRTVQVLSHPRPSPLGGFAVILEQDGPGDSTSIERLPVSPSPLILQHDERAAVRVLDHDEMITDMARGSTTFAEMMEGHRKMMADFDAGLIALPNDRKRRDTETSTVFDHLLKDDDAT